MAEETIGEAPKAEITALEADMDRLAGEIMRHKEILEKETPDHKEILKQAIRAIGPAPQAPAAAAATDSPFLPSYAANSSPEVKLEIEYLVDMALRQGIGRANATAKNSSPFVLDAFHDALAGKLYPELKKRKILD
jgi:hypothetical protein